MFIEVPKDVYTLEDKQAVYTSIKERAGEKCPLSAISKDAGIRISQVRFMTILLTHWGYVERVCLVDMGPHYKRYTFRVNPDKDYNKDLYEDKDYQQGADKFGEESAKVRNNIEGDY